MAQDFFRDRGNDPRWRLLSAAQDRLARADALADIIDIVKSTARAMCSADGVTFVLQENNYCHYVDEDAIAPLWKDQRFPSDACISGWSMKNGKTAVIEDIFEDDRIPHDVYRRTFVKSMIMTPVGKDTAVAAIGAYWQERRIFSDDEIAVMVALAASVATAMKGACAA